MEARSSSAPPISELQELISSRAQFYQQANENGMVKQVSVLSSKDNVSIVEV